MRKCTRKRQAVEPAIGHLNSDEPMGRNWLKGTEGHQMNAMLACAGHNLRLIPRKLGKILPAGIPRQMERLFINFLPEILRDK